MSKVQTILDEKVFEALGKASMCWSETPKGVFESEKASQIGDELIEEINKSKNESYKQGKESIVIDENTSDGYHTFKELYEFRKLYNACFFKELIQRGVPVHKSIRHHDGELCFGGGWFIVTAQLPDGQISNHYEMNDWDLFQCEEKETADEWDGHTAQDVVERLTKFIMRGWNV